MKKYCKDHQRVYYFSIKFQNTDMCVKNPINQILCGIPISARIIDFDVTSPVHKERIIL